jgi:hypothetical protein
MPPKKLERETGFEPDEYIINSSAYKKYNTHPIKTEYIVTGKNKLFKGKYSPKNAWDQEPETSTAILITGEVEGL